MDCISGVQVNDKESATSVDISPSEVVVEGQSRESPVLPGPGDTDYCEIVDEGESHSAFHRIEQDELWHFYDGTSLTIHSIDPAGNYSVITLGRDLHADERPLAIVQAGYLFGACVNNPESYALVGCTVAPGFDFEDFAMPDRVQLLEQYPQHKHIIEKLTR